MIKIEVCYNVIPRLDRGIQKTNTSKLKEFQYILKSSLTNKKWDNVLQNDELKEVFVDLKANKRGSKRIAIVYPNSYYVGMSNLGFQGLFYKFSSQDNFNVNRFFYDATSAKKVFSPENHFSLKQADIILISISFETDFIFFIEILLANGIETNVLKREAPFIGIGGVFPSLNPIFFINIVNIVFCGEFECYINELFMFCSSLESSKKINMLDLYSNIENIFNKFS
ncbi:MAG: hypothetical protein OEV44_14695, partial [Spirochaetota bacterium]|nr:hypothetical protein [Spirochaetota bacterium]